MHLSIVPPKLPGVNRKESVDFQEGQAVTLQSELAEILYYQKRKFYILREKGSEEEDVKKLL